MSLTQRLALVLVLVLAVPLAASAQDADPAAQAQQLLRRAQQAYFRLRMDEAQQLIIQAVSICERGSCPAAERAVLYVALGSIAHTASGDGLRARMAFDRALNLDPDVALDRNLATPEVRAIYDEVRASHRGEAGAATQTQAPESEPDAPRPDSPRQEAGERCTISANCAEGLSCVDSVCEEDAEIDDTEELETGHERRRLFFVELGWSLTSAYAHSNMQVGTRPNTQFRGEDFQNPGRGDDDSYVLSDTHGCHAPDDEYCVRVTDGLFTFANGFHGTLGVYATEHFGLAARIRVAPAAGGGKLDRWVFGARIYYRPIAPLPEGFHLAMFVGPMYGQIQVHPRQEVTNAGASIARPWGQTGLYGAELGVPFGYRLTSAFGMFVSPEAYVLAPRFSFGFQMTAGIDVAFGDVAN